MKRFEWTKIMETEFQAVKHIFTHQIRLSPLEMDKKSTLPRTEPIQPELVSYCTRMPTILRKVKMLK